MTVVSRTQTTPAQETPMLRRGANSSQFQALFRDDSARTDRSTATPANRQNSVADVGRGGSLPAATVPSAPRPSAPVPVPSWSPPANTSPASPSVPTTPAVKGTTTVDAGGSEHPGLIHLREMLAAQGINTSGLSISYDQQTVGYPGGSYVNRSIVVSGNGKSERYSADLTERNPQVTVTEMQRLFGLTAAPSNARG